LGEEPMAVTTGNVKKQKSMVGIVALCGGLLTTIFIAVFLSTKNINMSFDAFSSNDKYRAEAFVKKRRGLIAATLEGASPSTGVLSGADLTTSIDFDTSDKKVKLQVRDQNNRPVSRIQVTGTIVQVGKTGKVRQFKMQEYGTGDYRSAPLELSDGGWVLTVSAYDPYTLKKEKLLFHTERAIFLGEK
jgi:FixH